MSIPDYTVIEVRTFFAKCAGGLYTNGFNNEESHPVVFGALATLKNFEGANYEPSTSTKIKELFKFYDDWAGCLDEKKPLPKEDNDNFAAVVSAVLGAQAFSKANVDRMEKERAEV